MAVESPYLPVPPPEVPPLPELPPEVPPLPELPPEVPPLEVPPELPVPVPCDLSPSTVLWSAAISVWREAMRVSRLSSLAVSRPVLRPSADRLSRVEVTIPESSVSPTDIESRVASVAPICWVASGETSTPEEARTPSMAVTLCSRGARSTCCAVLLVASS